MEMDDLNLQEYEWDEIKKHNNRDSLWIVLYGRVYDVTKFMTEHPGGSDILIDVAQTGYFYVCVYVCVCICISIYVNFTTKIIHA